MTLEPTIQSDKAVMGKFDRMELFLWIHIEIYGKLNHQTLNTGPWTQNDCVEETFYLNDFFMINMYDVVDSIFKLYIIKRTKQARLSGVHIFQYYNDSNILLHVLHFVV